VPPGLERPRLVVGMERLVPAVARAFLGGQSRVVEPLLVEIDVPTIRPRDPDHLRHGLGQHAELVQAGLQRLRRALARGDVLGDHDDGGNLAISVDDRDLVRLDPQVGAVRVLKFLDDPQLRRPRLDHLEIVETILCGVSWIDFERGLSLDLLDGLAGSVGGSLVDAQDPIVDTFEPDHGGHHVEQRAQLGVVLLHGEGGRGLVGGLAVAQLLLSAPQQERSSVTSHDRIDFTRGQLLQATLSVNERLDESGELVGILRPG
jgi:hypothetical protein